MSNASPGATMGVDWEQRVDFETLRVDRLGRAKAALDSSDLGALLLFDPNNIRYTTSTHIGEWARDKNARFVLLPRGGDPILWDFGSAARHHRLYAPWLPESSFQAGVTPMRGAMPDDTGIPQQMAEQIARELRERGLEAEPVGIDMTDMVALHALQRAGLKTADGSQVILAAREIKTPEEVQLLEHAAAIVDGVYEEIYRMLRPGITENEIVAHAMKYLFERGSEQVEAINAVTGPRSNPHPHVFSDRLLRPGDTAFFDIIHSFMGYRTCYYRCFSVGGASQSQVDAYKQCREWLDTAIALIKPGQTTDEIAKVWPSAEELGFADEAACFGLQFAHGLGVGLYESPMISRLHSLERPTELKEGQVFAIETYCAGRDGVSAARIEEEVVVTADGCRLITKFPAGELLVAGTTYVRGADLVPASASDAARTDGNGVRADAGVSPGY
jgi:Xaa-Pro aminopeptidase